MVDQQDDRPFNQHLTETPRSRFDILTLPESQQQVLRIITRQRGVSLSEIAQQLNQEEAAIHTVLNALVEQGFVQQIATEGEPHYQTNLTAKRGRLSLEGIWQRLEGEE